METKQQRDVDGLRHLVGALANLSALPAAWESRDAQSIAEHLCQAVVESVPVAFAYAELHGGAGSRVEALVRPSTPAASPAGTEPLQILRQLVRAPDRDQTIADPFGTGSVRVTVTPVGVGGDCGCIVAGSPSMDFPGETARLLLTIAANQAAIVLQHQVAQQALRESETRFSQFMQHLPGLAWIKDTDGRYVFANHGAEKAFRMSGAQLHGKTDDEIFPPETASRFRENDRLALARPSGLQLIESLMHDDGIVHHSVVSKFPIPGSDGTPVLIGGIAFDITDRIQAEKTALEASRQKDAFFAVLGHELRNPLSPMLTALQVMRMRGVADREVEILERQVRHMRRLVEDLLDVSRVTSGKVQLHLEDVDLAEILERTLETVGSLLEQRRHRLHVQVASRPIGVRADPERLTQIITNLLVNAAKYSDEGTGIYIDASVGDDFARLSVRDEGIGIAPEMLDTIFDTFVQRPESVERSWDGLGVGLAVVRSLVRQHGGRVFARSEGTGKGSEFVVELPSVSVLEPEPAQPTPVRPHAAISRRERVLLVDDNRDAAETLHAGLVHHGFEVELAFEPSTALEIARDFRPGIALLDIGMPGMSGYELAPRLRALLEPNVMLRLVAVTGFGQPADRERALAAGFDRHLVKPVDLKTLMRTLDELCA